MFGLPHNWFMIVLHYIDLDRGKLSCFCTGSQVI